jgi:hypothetical protein
MQNRRIVVAAGRLLHPSPYPLRLSEMLREGPAAVCIHKRPGLPIDFGFQVQVGRLAQTVHKFLLTEGIAEIIVVDVL